jgi:hypothetical protein
MGTNRPDESGAPTNEARRRLLTLMGAGGAAIVASQLASPEAQAGHDSTNTFHLGESNTAPAGSVTQLHGSAADPDPTLRISNASGRALEADGPSVFSADEAEAGTLTLFNGNSTGFALRAEVFGGPDAVGVRGIASSEGGGFGEGAGEGVQGSAGTGFGVMGITQSGVGVTCRAETPAGIALQVRGRAAFSSQGTGTVPAGQSSVFVADSNVTEEETHITVTMVSDPGSRYVRWVQRDHDAGGFTVHMSAAPPPQRPETHFTYLITEPYEEE